MTAADARREEQAGLLAVEACRLAMDADALAARAVQGVPLADDARALAEQALRVLTRAARLDTIRTQGGDR